MLKTSSSLSSTHIHIFIYTFSAQTVIWGVSFFIFCFPKNKHSLSPSPVLIPLYTHTQTQPKTLKLHWPLPTLLHPPRLHSKKKTSTPEHSRCLFKKKKRKKTLCQHDLKNCNPHGGKGGRQFSKSKNKKRSIISLVLVFVFILRVGAGDGGDGRWKKNRNNIIIKSSPKNPANKFLFFTKIVTNERKK